MTSLSAVPGISHSIFFRFFMVFAVFIALTGCVKKGGTLPGGAGFIEVVPVPENVFTLFDEAMAIHVRPQAGRRVPGVAIDLTPIKAKRADLKNVSLLEYTDGKITRELKFIRKGEKIIADLKGGQTYLILKTQAIGRVHDTYAALGAVHRFKQRINPALGGRICSLILCAPDMFRAGELFSRVPEFNEFHDTMAKDIGGGEVLDQLNIGGWFPPGPGNICERCTGFNRGGLIFPIPGWHRPPDPPANLCELVPATPPTANATCNEPFDPASVNTATWEQFKPVSCTPSTARLFANTGPNDIFEFELQADFDVINDPTITQVNKAQAKSPGTLRYVDRGTNQTVAIPIMLQARGKSRYNHCAFRPLKIVFGAHQVGNIFEGASKKVKVVTHCGNHPTSPWILGGTPEEQRRRLLAEYYFYQTLETLGSTALATRLARITYRDDDGSEIITEYAFLREREDDSCVRCGFVDEAEDFDNLTPDPTSVFQGTLYNKFVYNNDFAIVGGHNTRRCKDASLNGFYIPYDWDLTGVIRPEYNGGINYQDNVANLWAWLDGQTPAVRTQVQAWHLAAHEAAMRHVIDNSLLDAEGKELMQGWFNLYMCSVNCFLGKQCTVCQTACTLRGDDSLAVFDFESDTVGSPPGAGLNVSGSAGTAVVVNSLVLGSQALKMTRGSKPTEVDAVVANTDGTPLTSGRVYIDFQAHGEVIPDQLIAGQVISIRDSNENLILNMKLFSGAYHLLEGVSYVRLDGGYDPGVKHKVHITVDLTGKKYTICIDGNIVAHNKPFASNAVTGLHMLKFFAPATITEAIQSEYVVDDINITR